MRGSGAEGNAEASPMKKDGMKTSSLRQNSGDKKHPALPSTGQKEQQEQRVNAKGEKAGSNGNCCSKIRVSGTVQASAAT